MIEKIKSNIESKTRLLNRRVFHFMVMGSIAAIFVFFFTTKLWMPAIGTIVETPIGTQLGSATTIQLKSWKQDISTGSHIVDLGLSHTNPGTIPEYGVSAIGSDGKTKDIEVMGDTNGFVILKIVDASKVKAIQLYVTVEELNLDGSVHTKATTYVFGMLRENIVDNEDIPDAFSEEQAILFDMNADLDLLNLLFEEQQEKMQSKAEFIQSAKDKIESLENSKTLKTAAEIEETDKEISQLESSIKTAEAEAEKIVVEYESLKGRIDDKEEKIELYMKDKNLTAKM